ncbi:hypothetical protein B0H14DRAFT_2577918 [Mycena olivaceomarginata]|nr:hypothetical protein B0H14DRAFT_2577918 [Mycena olivaceomarginata]
MATQTTSANVRQPGMEKGFALSPMGDLVREYNVQDKDLSIFIRSTRIAGKKVLERSEVMDRGVSLVLSPQSQDRFSLETGFWMRTERTIRELQALLNKAAGLVRGRLSTYEIDPHGILSALLKGSENLGGIVAAWIALSERVHLAQKNFDKYQSEYRVDKDEDILRSSVSTNPEIYGVFPRGRGAASDLDYLYDNILHLRKHWPPGYNVHDDSIDLVTPVPGDLQEAFPDRVPEERPATVYYSDQGERREISVSPRSSRGAGPDFQLPPISEDERSRKTRRVGEVEVAGKR